MSKNYTCCQNRMNRNRISPLYQSCSQGCLRSRYFVVYFCLRRGDKVESNEVWIFTLWNGDGGGYLMRKMPRKVSYNLDDDADYGGYDDYEYDYDEDFDYDSHARDAVELSQSGNNVSRLGLWRCSICTYDNEDHFSYCDICGVIRDPSSIKSSGGFEKVDGSTRNYGVSTMAKSLFAPLPSGTPEMASFLQQLNDESRSKGAVPFKFDSPSPDDIVWSGKNASRGTTKASVNASEKKEERKIQPLPKTSKSPSNVPIADGHKAAHSEVTAEILSSNMKKMNLEKGSSVPKKSIASRKNVPQSAYKPEKWMLDKEQGMLKQIHMAIVGHVDSGKSTLSGRLLHLLGRISQKEMHKYERESKEKGKGSFAYAWAMDESAEERERGVTMTVGMAYFNTKNYHVVLLDSPGHKDFVPNMISGATQADAAILVVDASIGSFEAGMVGSGGGQGQTREHAQLIRSFGVDQVVVVVNKMDVVHYSKDRFDLIKKELGSFLRSCQYKESSIAWIPASAMENQNLVKASSDDRLSSWYKGPCLLEAVDSLKPPEREVSKPLRLPIGDVTRSHSSGQVAATGKLESGAVRSGSKVLLMPSGELATVRSIEHDAHMCTTARAGDNVSVCLQGIDPANVISGGVICHPDYPVAVASSLQLRIYVLDIKMPILIGSQVEFHTHHAKEAAKVTKIISIIDQKTKETKKAPRLLTAKQSAVIEVVLDRAVCVEEFSNCRALGRAFLRASGNTIAVGTIMEIFS